MKQGHCHKSRAFIIENMKTCENSLKLKLVKTCANYEKYGQILEKSKKKQSDFGWTDRPTDGRTDRHSEI